MKEILHLLFIPIKKSQNSIVNEIGEMLLKNNIFLNLSIKKCLSILKKMIIFSFINLYTLYILT